jgi:hypothetical protein
MPWMLLFGTINAGFGMTAYCHGPIETTLR